MSQAHLGCFSGTVTPNVNMLDIFKQNERADNPNSILNFGQMSLRKLSMICPEGTKVKINGKEIPLSRNRNCNQCFGDRCLQYRRYVETYTR